MPKVAYQFAMGVMILPNMFVRGGVYYVRKRVRNGRRVSISLGLKVGDPPDKIYKKYLEVMGSEEHWSDKPATSTLQAFWAQYFEDRVRGKHSPRMVKEAGKRVVKLIDGEPVYRVVDDMKFILARHGSKDLTAFDETLAKGYIKERREATYVKGKRAFKYAPNTLTREFVTLAGVFKDAVRQGFIRVNPWTGVGAPIGHTGKIIVVTPQEQAQIVEQLKPEMARWFNFLIGTGLRCFEADAIKIEQIDFEHRTIRVLRKSRFAKPKWEDVPLVDDALIPLIRLQLEQKGQMWNLDYSEYWRTINRARLRAGITKRIGVHTLRHTFATRYLQAGKSIEHLSLILGHSSLKTTQIYGHLTAADLLALSKGVSLGLTPAPTAPDAPGVVLPFAKKA